METIKFNCEFTIVGSGSGLLKPYQPLISAAEKARGKAYSPYSKFQVGAAIVLDSGEIFTGNNQENSAYPSGLCAERVCVFHVSSQYPEGKVQAMAIKASFKGSEVSVSTTPCGACRQVLLEYEHRQNSPIKLILSWDNDEYLFVDSVEDLLPLPFSKFNLNPEKERN